MEPEGTLYVRDGEVVAERALVAPPAAIAPTASPISRPCAGYRMLRLRGLTGREATAQRPLERSPLDNARYVNLEAMTR